LDAYEDLSDRGRDFFNDAVDKGQTAAQSAGEFAGNLKDAARGFLRRAPESSNPQINLLIGALAGGALGAATIYALAKRKEEANFAQRIKSAGRKIGSVDWFDTAKNVLETIQNRINVHNESEVEGDVRLHNKLRDAIEFAHLGLRLWENIKKRR